MYGCASWLHEKPEKSFNFCQTNRPLQINGTRMSNQIFYGLFVGNKEHKEMANRSNIEQEMVGNREGYREIESMETDREKERKKE